MLLVRLGGELGGVDDDIPPEGRSVSEAPKLSHVAVAVGDLVEQGEVATRLLGGGLDLDEETVLERAIERHSEVSSAPQV